MILQNSCIQHQPAISSCPKSFHYHILQLLCMADVNDCRERINFLGKLLLNIYEVIFSLLFCKVSNQLSI